MALTKFTGVVANHQTLPDQPTNTPTELKVLFDKAATDIVTFINDTLTDEVDLLPTDGTVLTRTNTDVYTPTTNYHPATKKYVDDTTAGVVLGQIPDGTITKVKMGYDPTEYAGITAGSSNAYTVTLSTFSLTDGALIVIKCDRDQTDVGTLNVSGLGAKALKKPTGTDMKNMKTGGIYPYRYNVTTGNFILQGSDSSGDAIAAEILAGKTASTDLGDITGTMTDRTGDTSALSSSVSGTTLKLLASDGYRDGVNDNVTITDADFIAGNLPDGVSLFGLLGTRAAKRYAFGTATSNSSGVFTVTGLSFNPATVIISVSNGTQRWQATYSPTTPAGNTTDGYNANSASLYWATGSSGFSWLPCVWSSFSLGFTCAPHGTGAFSATYIAFE
jgi:hypothetical protein